MSAARIEVVKAYGSGALWGYRFECPGCKDTHRIHTVGDHAWGFNGSIERPTFTPSILVRSSFNEDGVMRDFCCHSFVRDGRIEFLGDCTHALAGQTVDLPDLPEVVS